jgi:hypothetical protein
MTIEESLRILRELKESENRFGGFTLSLDQALNVSKVINYLEKNKNYLQFQEAYFNDPKLIAERKEQEQFWFGKNEN